MKIIQSNNLKIIYFQSEPAISPFAPLYNYALCEDLIKGLDFKKLAIFLLDKEKEILALPFKIEEKIQDGYTGLGNNSTTSRYKSYNIFSWKNPELNFLFNKIKLTHEQFLSELGVPNVFDIGIKAWVNIMRHGQKILPHIHSVNSLCYLGGNIVIQSSDTKTIYINPINQINEPEEYHSQNEAGKITIFQNNIPHYTTEHSSDEPRITIAFDLVLSPFNKLPGIYIPLSSAKN